MGRIIRAGLLVFEVVVGVANAVADLLDVEERTVGDTHGTTERGQNGLQLVTFLGLGILDECGLVIRATMGLLLAQNAKGDVFLRTRRIEADKVAVVLSVDLTSPWIAEGIGRHHDGQGSQIERRGLGMRLEGVERVHGFPAWQAVVDAAMRTVVFRHRLRALGALGVGVTDTHAF